MITWRNCVLRAEFNPRLKFQPCKLKQRWNCNSRVEFGPRLKIFVLIHYLIGQFKTKFKEYQIKKKEYEEQKQLKALKFSTNINCKKYTTGVERLIIRGPIFIYSCSFEVYCLQGMQTRMYEYEPPLIIDLSTPVKYTYCLVRCQSTNFVSLYLAIDAVPLHWYKYDEFRDRGAGWLAGLKPHQ